MSRVIKFRAWSKDSQRIIDEPYHFEQSEDKYWCYEGWRDLEDGIRHDCELMQFTGLLDKNGKEIYEGDIVKHMAGNPEWDCLDDDSPVQIETTSAVEYRHRGFWLTNESFGWEGEGLVNWDRLEVIGNIYENPDLLTRLASDAATI